MSPEAIVNILLVDDQPENLLALEAILSDLGENLVQATSGAEALRCLLHQDFAVILLDVQMPDMDGFEVATLIRQRSRSSKTPIIFLTALSTSEQFMFQGYALGAVDYLIKPIAPSVLISKVSVFIELFKTTQSLRQKTAVLQAQTAQLERINAELQVSEERFRSLSQCSPVGVFVTDEAGHCIYTNPRLQSICEVSCSSGGYFDWLQTVHPDDGEAAKMTWQAYLREGHEYSREFRAKTADAPSRWIHVRSARMLSDQGQFLGHVGTVEDITGRKLADLTNTQIIREQAARQEAEAANRMKDEFIAVLSHELRTPLNSMLGWARLLRSKQYDAATTTRALEIIERNAHSQAKLIEDILDVSQIVRGKLQLNCHPINLATVIQSAIETVQPTATAKSIALVSHVDRQTPVRVKGDFVRLQQVVWNLLSNAVKFTPSGGQIDIRLEIDSHAVDREPWSIEREPQQTHGEEPTTPYSPSTISPPPPPSYANIIVTDTGSGIAPEFLPHVFDRFRQADSTITRSHGGLGLGLAIVHYLVEQHGGRVQANSAGIGKGATFTISLPLLPVESNTVSSPVVAPLGCHHTSLKEISVLVVDDDPDTRKLLAFLLQSEGATVTVAASASEALTLLESERPAVLLCDISMPEIDGYTLLRTLRNHPSPYQKTMPAIALTAHARHTDQQQALESGFQVHLPKPVEPQALVQAILQLSKPLPTPPQHQLSLEVTGVDQ